MKAIEASTFPFHLLSLLDIPNEPVGRGSTKSTTSIDHGLKRPFPAGDDNDDDDTRCNVQQDQYLQYYMKRRRSLMKQKPRIMMPPYYTYEQEHGTRIQNYFKQGFYANFSRRRHRRVVKRRKAMDHTKTFFSITHIVD